MLGLSTIEVIGCLALVFAGATVQGVVGIGTGLIASPLLVATDPAFIPGAMLIGILPLSIGVAVADHSHIDWSGFWAGLAGRIPGSVIGAAAVAAMSNTALSVTVAVVVYLGVILSVSGIRFMTTPRTMVTAGLASGFGATTVGIGGPPMALTYQRHDPQVVRSTLSTFFMVGSIMSIVLLTVTGSLGTRELQLGLMLLPAILAGLAMSRIVNPYIDAARLRPIILVLSAVSATTLLITEFA